MHWSCSFPQQVLTLTLFPATGADTDPCSHPASHFQMFTFKYLLVRKLTDNIGFEYSEVMAPLFVILNMVMVRACQL